MTDSPDRRPSSPIAADELPSGAGDASRRDFIRYGALVGVGAAIGVGGVGCASTQRSLSTRPAPDFATPPIERLRVGFVGVGGMGSNHVSQFLKCPGVEIRAVCDIVAEKVARISDQVEKAGQPRPTGYSRGPRDFERLCQTEDLDLVFTATPWEWHVPVCVAAMKCGKHAATEVPAAVTLDECWQMVETAEKFRKHCVMMENCCYDRAEMMILNMVRKGVFGEVLHGECGYLHDLRGVKFSTDGEGLWRRAHSSHRNGNLYPTHGLGPIANCMDINRGDRFDYLVSMSGPSRGLQLWQKEHLDAADPRRNEQYVLGDVNATLIKTARGRTIYVVHDTNLPRPYSRINMIQGTRGLFMDYPPRFHVEGRSPPHEWEKIDKYAEFEHPLWKSEDVKKASGGHGGMDYLEDYRLIKCLRAGTPLDMDVYDAAALSCICELTERSVANRSRSIDIPDFTRGRWMGRAPLGIVEA